MRSGLLVRVLVSYSIASRPALAAAGHRVHVSDGDAAGSAAKDGRGRVVAVGAASVVSALATYLLSVIAARTLPVAETTVLLTNFATLFLFYGVLAAVTTEFTRSVSVARHTGVAEGPPAWKASVLIAVVTSAVFLVSSAWWGRAPGTAVTLGTAVLMTVGVLGFSMHAATCGVLAGSDRWSVLAALVASEGSGRVVFALVALLIGASAGGFLAAVVAASFVWVVVVLLSRQARGSLQQRMDSGLRQQGSRLGAAFGAQASSAALTVSFPVLLSWTTAPEEYSLSAPLLLAITLTRAPLMVPLTSYQAMIVAHFATPRVRAGRDLAILAAGVATVGCVGAALAWLVGPSLFAWLISPQYRVDGFVMALLTLAAASLALVSLTGAVAQALSLHRWFVAGWVLALGGALALLALPGGLEHRAVWALAGGPLVGAGLHAWGIIRRRAAGPGEGSVTTD
jgi:hypothetical protein